MRKTAKRGISLFLAVVMLLSSAAIMTVPARAASTLYWPVPGHTSYSNYHQGKNNAIDIADGAIAGAPVIAAIGGTVREIHYCNSNHAGSYGDCGGNGNGLTILGDDGLYYNYAHMQAGSIPGDVYKGAYVSAGKQIGRVGNTGNAYGYHLHFQIFYSYSNVASGPNPSPNITTYNYSVPSTSVSVITLQNIRYPINVKQGTPFAIGSGSVSSPNPITYVWGAVYTNPECTNYVTGSDRSNINSKTFSFNTLENETRFSSLSAGTYYIAYGAIDTKGYTAFFSTSFTVSQNATSGTSTTVKGWHDHTNYWNSGKITTSPTCTATGTKTYTCTECGKTKTEALAALGHSTEFVPAKDATPTADGNIAHFRCTRCGRLFEDKAASKELSAEQVTVKYIISNPMTLSAPTLSVEQGTNYAEITIVADNIPQSGLCSALFYIRCRDLDIVDYRTADGLGGVGSFHSENRESITWYWVGIDDQRITESGTALITLRVKIPETAKAGDSFDIIVMPSADSDNFLDGRDNAVRVNVQNGSITIVPSTSYTPGDVNNDGKINAKDIIAIMRAILGDKPAEYTEAAADLNNDGKINAKDIIGIMRLMLGNK